MRREDLIINGRKLNFIQKWLFEKNDEKIRGYIKALYIYLMFFFAFVVINGYSQENNLYIWIIVAIEFITIKYYDKFVYKVVYIWLGDEYGNTPKDIENRLNKSWIINQERLSKLYAKSTFEKDDPRINIIINSSGHELIESFKEEVLEHIPTMVSEVDNITDTMMESVMKHYRKTNEEIKIDYKKYDFSKKPMQVLRNLYATANGILLENSFSKRALEIKPKEELLQFLNQKFTMKVQ